jgi:hypothetical protein
VLFAFRSSAYLMLRRVVLRDFKPIEYIKVFSVLLELITLCLTLAHHLRLLIFFTIVTMLCQIIHATSVVFLTEREAKASKRERAEGVQSSITENDLKIYTTTDATIL